MKIFTNAQRQAIVRYTIEHDGVTELDLVERAGEGIAREIMSRWQPQQRTVVFAGWGNNGADALAASRIMLRNGYNPEIYLFNIGGNRLSKECAKCKELLLSEFPQAKLTEVVASFNQPELNSRCLVIDGLFGSGLNRPLAQSLCMILRSINDSNADVVSIDIPSGLFSEWNTNLVNSNTIHATLTIAIEFPHLSFFFDDNAELIGEWTTVNIGLSQEAIRSIPYQYYLITHADAQKILRPRWPEANKSEYGSALICAGSYGMMGAAVLATRGCLRSGAGKVSCFAPQCGYQILQTAVPSAMFVTNSDKTHITDISPKHSYHAIGIGPGIGTHDDTISALERFLKKCNATHTPLVIDADALNCIAARPILLNYLPVMSVLTPHEGEFDRLFGEQQSSEERLRKAIEVSAFYNVVILLKGRYTAVVRPDGKVHINSSGSPALATGGSGDVLTGIITGLMAQAYSSEISSILGAYIHGVAGEICAEEQGVFGTTAEDIAQAVGRAIKSIVE